MSNDPLRAALSLRFGHSCFPEEMDIPGHADALARMAAYSDDAARVFQP